MASTLVKRICDVSLMTDEERSSVMSEKGYAEEADLKLALHAVVGVASEIVAGRLPSQAMLTWLTPSEYLDAVAIVAKINSGTLTVEALWLQLLLGERGIYDASTIETIWGL